MRSKIGVPFVITGVAIAAIPLLFFAKTTRTTTEPNGICQAQTAQVDEAVSQLNFSKSAETTVRSALSVSKQRQQTYLAASTSLEQQLFRLHANTLGRERVETVLARANATLMDDSGGLNHARELLQADEQIVAEGTTQIGAAAQALGNGDCAMARRLAVKAGWPKDTPYKDLSEAARLNVEASSKLDAALDLIMTAQRSIRRFGGTGSALR